MVLVKSFCVVRSCYQFDTRRWFWCKCRMHIGAAKVPPLRLHIHFSCWRVNPSIYLEAHNSASTLKRNASYVINHKNSLYVTFMQPIFTRAGCTEWHIMKCIEMGRILDSCSLVRNEISKWIKTGAIIRCNGCGRKCRFRYGIWWGYRLKCIKLLVKIRSDRFLINRSRCRYGYSIIECE